MYNPPDPTPSEVLLNATLFEFIEIYNAGSLALDLTGLTFSRGVTFSFNGFVIEPNEFIVVCNELLSFRSV